MSASICRRLALVVPLVALTLVLTHQPALAAQVFDRSFTEGNAGPVSHQFTIQGPFPAGSSVGYRTVDGTATVADNDYEPLNGRAVCPSAGDGCAVMFINIVIIGDTRYEPDETFTIELFDPLGTTIGASSTATITILNDDPVPPAATLSINDVSQNEGNSGTSVFNFTVSLTSAVQTPTVVNYVTADGTATVADNDYIAANSSVTILAGATTATIPITVIGDTKIEPDETFTVTISSSAYPITRATGTGTILNDDFDVTPPVVSPVIVGTLGNNGWYTSNVSVSWTVSDPESAISGKLPACDVVTTISTDTAGTTVTCSATSAGGTTNESVTIKRDATAPTGVSGTPDRAANVNGWYNASVSVNFSGQDAMSGIASCTTAASYSGPDSAAATVAGSCTDNAGNTANGVFNLKYDATAPTNVAGTPARSADSNGWYNAPVNVSFSGQDATSGIASCTTNAEYAGPDNLAASVPGSCTDNAGNSATGSFNLQYDATAPTNIVGTPDREPNSNGWYTAPVTVDFSGSDSISGIANCTSAASYVGPDNSSASIPGTCTDNAGNSANGVFNLQYDATDPILTVPENITEEATSGDGASVSFSVSATDTITSDPDVECSRATGALFPLGDTEVQCTATDEAGNQDQKTFTVSVVDTTAPKLTLPSPISLNATSPAGAIVVFIVTAVDLVDPDPGISCSHQSGAVFQPGTTTVTCTATDKANNQVQGSFTVAVLGSRDQLSILIQDVRETRMLSPLKVTFVTALNLADLMIRSNQPTAACALLVSFEARVHSMAGRLIPRDDASRFLSDSHGVRNSLGCSGNRIRR